MIAQNQQSQKDIILWLKKAVWTINKIITMVEEDKYCADIASQVNAAMWLLKSVNNKLLENHLKCCGTRFLASQNANEVDQFVKELIRTWDVAKK
jgi:CsoR family transcriptional regulator, copper-sensing transcriptional repressor